MRRLLAAAALASALMLGGCGGGEDDSTPVACLEGPDVYLTALESAPGAVRLRGEVPISECPVENQTGGDLATMGTSMLDAATTLNAEARRDPGGAANLEVGYLIGAVTRGVESTQGIHSELLRRLVAGARYSSRGEPPAAVFVDTFQRGFQAGRERG